MTTILTIHPGGIGNEHSPLSLSVTRQVTPVAKLPLFEKDKSVAVILGDFEVAPGITRGVAYLGLEGMNYQITKLKTDASPERPIQVCDLTLAGYPLIHFTLQVEHNPLSK